MKKFLGLFVLLLGFGQMTATEIVVPERVKFCDLSLTLDKGARTYIKDFIGKLRRSPSHFQSLVNRCDLHMPLVEQALDEAGVPQDLKFLAIQESAFNGGAVSKSGAIGYWQFKEPAAREVGLVINRQMDERKHLYRASIGAARYLFRINRDFNNWLYAVVGYNRGPVGAKAHISSKYFGKKQMPVTSKTHWYALKAISYKLAFQHELGKGGAKTRLELRSAEGESSVKRLVAKLNVDEATFKKHNQWIKGDKIPEVAGLQCLVPVEGAGPIAQVKNKITPPKATEPKPKVGGNRPREKPQPPAAAVRNTRRFTYLSPSQDPDHGKDYAVLKRNEKVVEVAVRYRKKVSKLNDYNGFEVYSRPEAGTVIRLKPASKMRFHIVSAGENWRSIAKEHDLDQKKLMKANRTRQLGSKLYPGQKVYLKGKKPKGEKVILLDAALKGPVVNKKKKAKPVAKPKPQAKPKAKPARSPKAKPASKPSKARGQSSKGAVHKVKPGETLWRISQRYGMTVDELKRANGLRSNEIHVGQVLKVKRK